MPSDNDAGAGGSASAGVLHSAADGCMALSCTFFTGGCKHDCHDGTGNKGQHMEMCIIECVLGPF